MISRQLGKAGFVISPARKRRSHEGIFVYLMGKDARISIDFDVHTDEHLSVANEIVATLVKLGYEVDASLDGEVWAITVKRPDTPPRRPNREKDE